MRFALSSARIARVLVLAMPCLAPFLSGCDESYPKDLTYPPRTDPIVIKVPSAQPFETTGPGQLDINIAKFGTGDFGGQIYDPKKLEAKDRQDLETALKNVFGTPAAPKVDPGADEDAKQQVADLKLDEDTLAKGSVHYRRHCMHCHGVPGDGRGPTGPWISPHPRDYRQGIFKFISTALKDEKDKDLVGRKPRRADLRRTLEHGIDGTSMPSFGLLADQDLEQLVSYVIHLSLRGQVEKDTMATILSSGKEALEGESIKENVSSLLGTFLTYWTKSNRKGMQPASYPYQDGDRDKLASSIRRGYDYYTDPKGKGSCIACHLDFGRQVPFRYDSWGTLVRPANLTAGVYRGGRRPIDLYYRIRGGIEGSDMPKAELGSGADKSADPYWDLVNFVQALPYPAMLPEDIRDKIYPPHEKKADTHAQR